MKRLILSTFLLFHTLFLLGQEQGNTTIQWIEKRDFPFGAFSYNIPQFSSEMDGSLLPPKTPLE